MKKSLVIVESPSKARTLSTYLGKDFIVKASVGHVRDLPKTKLGVDIAKGFQPQYVLIKGKKKVLQEIEKAAETADKIYLGPDPDREGEAIAWHIAEELDGGRKNKRKIYRVLFHEITERGIRQALDHPGKINMHLVNAQQARRVLDRLVGYTISPLLWQKVRRGLSAGRVQSVAVRLICEREEEIKAHISEEYWTITAHLEGSTPPRFLARLVRVSGADCRPATEADARRLVEAASHKEFRVTEIEKKERKRNPPAPFITSRLQQEASKSLKFTPKKTMALAQGLYEGMDVGEKGPVGLITYMRTDSTRVAAEAIEAVREYIQGRFGRDFLPPRPNVYKNKKGAQDAHEAIRPTSVTLDPETIKLHLSRDHYLLYRLIWERFLASQMPPMLLDVTRVEIAAGDHLFRATGSVVKFQGFSVLYTEGKEEPQPQGGQKEGGEADEEEGKVLPPLRVGEVLRLLELTPEQHFTQPPPRYNEALLIKELEEKGIGRPSTYHTITSTIQDRKYVEKVEGRFRPTELGGIVNGLLVAHFPDVLNIQFTARMEEDLDEVEEGEKDWVEAVRGFYEPFNKSLEKARDEMKDVKREEIPTEITCDKCGKKMVIKWGRNGRFLACPGYPDCKNTREFVEDKGTITVVEKEVLTSEVCPSCGKMMVIKRGRFGRFLACSGYPQCKTTRALGTGVRCPREGCGGELVEKRTKKGKPFYACRNYPTCEYALWERPLPKACPECGAPFLVEKRDRQQGSRVVCVGKDCQYVER